VPRSTYRPDPWLGAEWVVLVCGVVAAAAFVVLSRVAPDGLTMPLTPLGVPPLPVAAVVGLLIGALPAYLTPEPPRPSSRAPRRGAREMVGSRG
jgi:energy-coupling factor transport system permease protein